MGDLLRAPREVRNATPAPQRTLAGPPRRRQHRRHRPTLAACETIELGVQLTGVKTIIERKHGDQIHQRAGSGRGFGIMAGTGTGTTLAIRLQSAADARPAASAAAESP